MNQAPTQSTGKMFCSHTMVPVVKFRSLYSSMSCLTEGSPACNQHDVPCHLSKQNWLCTLPRLHHVVAQTARLLQFALIAMSLLDMG